MKKYRKIEISGAFFSIIVIFNLSLLLIQFLTTRSEAFHEVDVNNCVHLLSNVIVILEICLALASARKCSEIQKKFLRFEKNFGFDEKIKLQDHLLFPVLSLVFVLFMDIAQYTSFHNGKSFPEILTIIAGYIFEMGNVLHVMQFSIYLCSLRKLSRVLNNKLRELILMGGSDGCDETHMLKPILKMQKLKGRTKMEIGEVHHPPLFAPKNKILTFRILSKDEKYKNIKICGFLYHEIFKLSQDINETFATRNLINVAYNFATAFVFINPALTAAIEFFRSKLIIKYDRNEISVDHIFHCKWTIICFISIYSMICSCELTVAESYTVYPLLYEVSAIPLDENLQAEINRFAFQVMQHQMIFSPHDFFTLNNSLFLSILATFASYLIALIQLKIQT